MRAFALMSVRGKGDTINNSYIHITNFLFFFSLFSALTILPTTGLKHTAMRCNIIINDMLHSMNVCFSLMACSMRADNERATLMRACM